MNLKPENFRALTDGSERNLPEGSVGSVITCELRDAYFFIEATVNGIRGQNGRNVGFAQVKAMTPDIAVGSSFALAFTASAKLRRKWSIVLTTDSSEEADRLRGDGAIMTYQAHFHSPSTATLVTLPLDLFKATIRGRELPGPHLTEEVARRSVTLKTLGFQVTRNATEEGRADLEPIEADLYIVNALILFR